MNPAEYATLLRGDTALLLFGLLTLMGIVGGLCFHFGYRAAASYLSAARAVSEVANAAVSQASDHAATLDGLRLQMASLSDAVQANTKTNAERQQGIEDALLQLFTGLQQAGLARSPRAVPRQHGETADG